MRNKLIGNADEKLASNGEERDLTMKIFDRLDGFGVFMIGLEIEDRPIFRDWALDRGAKSVSVIKINRPVSEYDFRVKKFDNSVFVVRENYDLKPDDLAYMRDEGVVFACLRKINGRFDLAELDIELEFVRISPLEVIQEEEIDPAEDEVQKLMFGASELSATLAPGWGHGVPLDQVSPQDITMVVCLRAHEQNPWVIDRLAAMGAFYDPAPKIQIIDFGSDVEYSEVIEELCDSQGLLYAYVDDRDVFSLAKARNVGASLSTTDLLFFSDIDFVFPRNFFADLARTSSVLAARSRIDILLMCSAVHLSQSASEQYVALGSDGERSALLEQIGFSSLYEQFGESVQFVAPYSNVFLINKTLFSLAGGYEESFRGHGSEDFEFVSRVNLYTGHFPMPPEITADTGGPLKADFYKSKKYKGFRALNTVTSLPGQLMGLRAYHLYHPTPQDTWRSNNDWKRGKLKEVMAKYIESPERVLEIDYMARPKKALCVCMHKDHWGYFAPLRLAGYELVPIYDGSVDNISEATSMITSGDIDAFVIYNPYMDSHKRFFGLYHLAKKHCKVVVIERGALPRTVYYADDVAYTSQQYSEEAFAIYAPTDAELEYADQYIASLRAGTSMLEDGDPYSFTMRKYAPLVALDRKIVFLPLQMSEDMAVTMFVRKAQSYSDYVSVINQIADENRDTLFVIKPHPLTKGGVEFKGSNILIADRKDNVHALIDLSSTVIAYNSGVALLAFAHEKPVWTIGNAYFNLGGAGKFADSLEQAIDQFQSGAIDVDRAAIVKVYAWLLSRMYSSFTATDNVREFQTRKAHGYKDIVIGSLRLDGESVCVERSRASSQGIATTLGAALLNFDSIPGS